MFDASDVFLGFDLLYSLGIIVFAPLAQLVRSSELIIRGSQVQVLHGAPLKYNFVFYPTIVQNGLILP